MEAEVGKRNPFDESSEPKSVHRGSSKNHLDKIQFLVEFCN
jgi:hypothetical protein